MAREESCKVSPPIIRLMQSAVTYAHWHTTYQLDECDAPPSCPPLMPRASNRPQVCSQWHHEATLRRPQRRRVEFPRWINMRATAILISILATTTLVTCSVPPSQQQDSDHHHYHDRHRQQTTKNNDNNEEATETGPMAQYSQESLMSSQLHDIDGPQTIPPARLGNDDAHEDNVSNGVTDRPSLGSPLCDDCLAIPLVAIMGDKQINGFIIKPVPNRTANIATSSGRYEDQPEHSVQGLHLYQRQYHHDYHQRNDYGPSSNHSSSNSNSNNHQDHHHYRHQNQANYEKQPPPTRPPTPEKPGRHPFGPQSDDKCPMTGPLTVCDQIGSYPADEILAKLEVAKKRLSQSYFNIESLFSDERDHSSDPFDDTRANSESKRRPRTWTASPSPMEAALAAATTTTTITPPLRSGHHEQREQLNRGAFGASGKQMSQTTTLISSNRSYGLPSLANSANTNIDRGRYTKTTTNTATTTSTNAEASSRRTPERNSNGAKHPEPGSELTLGASLGPNNHRRPEQQSEASGAARWIHPASRHKNRAKTVPHQNQVGASRLGPRQSTARDQGNYSIEHQRQYDPRSRAPLASDFAPLNPLGTLNGLRELPQPTDQQGRHLGSEMHQPVVSRGEGPVAAVKLAPTATRTTTITTTTNIATSTGHALADQRQPKAVASLETEFLHLVERQAISLETPRRKQQPLSWMSIGPQEVGRSSGQTSEPNEQPYQFRLGNSDYTTSRGALNVISNKNKQDEDHQWQWQQQQRRQDLDATRGESSHDTSETIAKPTKLVAGATFVRQLSPANDSGANLSATYIAFGNANNRTHTNGINSNGPSLAIKADLGRQQAPTASRSGPPSFQGNSTVARQVASLKLRKDQDDNKPSVSNLKRSRRQTTRARVSPGNGGDVADGDSDGDGDGGSSGGGIISNSEQVDPERSSDVSTSGLPPTTDDGGTPSNGPLVVQPEPICRAKSIYISPKVALNDKKQWKYVVNARERDPNIKQIIRVDICENSFGQCSNQLSLPFGFTSQCKQKYAKKKLLALDAETGLLEVDTFFIPSCCVCQIVADAGQPLPVEDSSMLEGQISPLTITTDNTSLIDDPQEST